MSYNERLKDFKKTKKDNPRIIGDDIYRYISNNSKLKVNREQARECFYLYSQIIKGLYMSPYVETDMTILLPYLGHFHLNKRNGRKSGSTYKMFNREITLDKSEPSFFQIRFKVYKTLYNKIKDKTKHYE